MKRKPSHRALAMFLAAQPVLWMSNAAQAQAQAQVQALAQAQAQAVQPTLVQPSPEFSTTGTAATAPAPAPAAPSDTEVVRGDRGVVAIGTATVPALDEPFDPDRYVLGNGDVLELNFWGLQNFKLRITIDLEGRAFVPKVGYFDLRGKSLTEARAVLRERVARLYPALGFGATLVEPRTFLVQLVDDVARPGSYPARAIDRVLTVIARAGGFGRNASKRRVEIRHRDGTTVIADLVLYTLTGDVKHNPYLLDGDVVRVPFEELAATIGGAVNRPGRWELVKTKDLAELLEIAGGLSPQVTQLLPLTLVRRGPGDHSDLSSIPFVDGKLPALALQSEDVVTIPSATELQQSVTIVGAVAGASPAAAAVATTSAHAAPDESSATRRLPFVKGDTVRTLLERVGGVGPLADLSGAYIYRKGETVPVDLYTLVMLRDFRADRGIELGDTLVIPFKRRNILVEGAVFAPGAYPYNPSYGVAEYVSLAGGRSRNAQSIEAVKVVTPSGETKEYKPDLKIEAGSSLVVPERNFSRTEVVQILLGIGGLVISGVAVVLAARK